MNVFSFLPYNAGGDGDDVWPFVFRDEKFHYDCSKLDQWNIVFTHGQSKGLFLHFKLQETENDDNNSGHGSKNKNGKVPTSLDGGYLGPERKLYLRELVARFGHHLALNWNLGEENTQTTKQQVAMATYLRALDPYHHHLVVHTFPDQQDKVYKPLLGTDPFTGLSLQNSHFKDVHWQTVKWNRESIKAQKPWCITFDEPGDAQYGMPPDPDYPDYPGMPKDYKGPTLDRTRQRVLWGNLMGGGWGVEYYFGYKLPQNDLVCEDWRSRDQSWDSAKIALDFFTDQKIPFWEMTPQDELIGNPKHDNTAYCLGEKGLYLVYFPNGKGASLQLPEGETGESIQWFNPRDGKLKYQTKWDSAPVISSPPGGDWLAIIRTKSSAQ
ncbi:MAG: putative collagen-binding domain-containing protein [Akkermansiaceae bacterium]